jgi:Uma2 family endonuclease
MVIAAPELKADLQPVGEQRVVIRGLSWDAYLQILHALPQSRASRLTYDDGMLEITVPLELHEFSGRLIERFIITLIEVMGLRIKTMGSTTMNYPNLQKGAEPDNAYYIQNQPLVKGRNVDFSQDPPPDLVVEVDITHTDIAKNQFYSSLGVSESRKCVYRSSSQPHLSPSAQRTPVYILGGSKRRRNRGSSISPILVAAISG